MTGGRLFSLSSPDWGQDHLSLDAVVAYVDDELTTGPHARAEAHLQGCPGCRAEVVAQRQARAALRAAAGPRLPSSLLHNLRSIPVEAELPPPPPGLGITADGQFVLLRDMPRAESGSDAHPAASDPHAGGSRWSSRRTRFGAVSGLAIGALAVGALAVPGPSPQQGVFGGAVLDVPAQARPSAGPDTPSGGGAAIPAVVDRPATPAVIDGSNGGATADPGVATPVGATAGAAPGSTATVNASTDGPDPSEADAVLGPVRARLERMPVAFSRTP